MIRCGGGLTGQCSFGCGAGLYSRGILAYHELSEHLQGGAGITLKEAGNVAAGLGGAVTRHTRRVRMALQVGDPAPDFKLPANTGDKTGDFQLSSYRGKNVVLLFYPLDFTPV